MSITAVLLGAVYVAQIWIFAPTATQPLPVFTGDETSIPTGLFQLDPNRSPADSLELLPGIGPVLARRIAEYRANHHFDSLDDLKNVKGINDKLLEKLSPYLRIRQ